MRRVIVNSVPLIALCNAGAVVHKKSRNANYEV